MTKKSAALEQLAQMLAQMEISKETAPKPPPVYVIDTIYTPPPAGR